MQGEADARVAEESGADRIELCSALVVGGVTPGPGLWQVAQAAVGIPITVLLRPRRGDFVYDQAEQRAVEADIAFARKCGVRGVALGCLTRGGQIDRDCLARWVELAGPLEVTFHRAFDHTRDLSEALEVLRLSGVARVLSSGGAASAEEGVHVLKGLVAQAGSDLRIVPAAGISPQNAVALLQVSGARDLHLSASRLVQRHAAWRASSTEPPLERPCGLGAARLPEEDELKTTDGEQIRELLRTLDPSRGN